MAFSREQLASRYHVLWLVAAGGVLSAALALSIRGPAEVVLPVIDWPLPPLCALQRIAGLPCPGCGLTRSLIACAHGNLAAAWSYNPAGLLLFAMVAFQIPFRAYQLWRIRHGRPEASLGIAVPLALGGLVIGMLGQWVLRLLGVAW